MRIDPGRWVPFLFALHLSLSSETGQAPPATEPQPHSFLRTRVGFSTSDLANLDRGRPVVKSLRGADRREVATLGAIRVEVPSAFFLTQFRDIVTFKRSDLVLQIGRFSEPPVAEDLGSLTFEPADLDGLRDCRIGDCNLRLSADQIRRIRQEIDWSARGAPARAGALLREMLTEYARAYRAGGNSALIEYRDKRNPIRLADEFRSLIERSSTLLDEVPAFREYLIGHPPRALPHLDEFTYWSKEQFGFKPVVSLTHVLIHRPESPGIADSVIASKQLYASRYFDGSLSLTLVVDDRSPASARPAFYMLYMNRTLANTFPALVGGLMRRIVQGRTQSGMDDNLRLAKERLEAAYATEQMESQQAPSARLPHPAAEYANRVESKRAVAGSARIMLPDSRRAGLTPTKE